MRLGPPGARPQSALHAIDLPPLARSSSHPEDESGIRARPLGRSEEEDEPRARALRESARVPSSPGGRVQSILESAATCFARRGFTATTLADIGHLLGLRKSIVHYYFSGKAALVREVQDSTSSNYLANLERILGGDSARTGDQEQQPPQSGEAVRSNQPAGLAGLWQQLVDDPIQRGLNLEFWAVARRDAELGRVTALVRDRTHELLERALAPGSRAGREGTKPPARASGAGEYEDAALATLTMAVLDGLTVLAEDANSRLERGEIDDLEANARMQELAQSYALFIERCARG